MRELLQQCGLNVTQQAVLLDLLEHSHSIPGRIAKRTGINRTTAYSALASLVELGLITKESVKGVAHFFIEDPEHIPELLRLNAERRYRSVAEAVELLKPRVQSYPKRSRTTISGLVITTHESRRAFFSAFERALSVDGYLSLFDPQMVFLLPEVVAINKRFIKHCRITKPLVKEVVIASGAADKWRRAVAGNPNHLVRELPWHEPLQSDFILSNGTVFISHYRPDAPLMVEIKHPDLYKLMHTLFEIVWLKLGR